MMSDPLSRIASKPSLYALAPKPYYLQYAISALGNHEI
jgi:hypothetical protein